MKAALRLRRSAEFARVARSGATYRHPALRIGVRKNALPHNRYGIVTSRRLGNAVARNRCKRRLRAVLFSLHSQLKQGYDIVVIARAAAMGQPFGDLQRIVHRLLAKARLAGCG